MVNDTISDAATNGTSLSGIFNELLVTGHPAVIHFPIFGVMMAAAAAITALALAISLDVFSEASWLTKERRLYVMKFIDRFEFSSWILVFIGELSLIVAGWSGFEAGGGIDSSVNNELLSYKITLSIIVFFVLGAPLSLKVLMSFKYKKDIFGHSRIIPVLYITPLIISAVMIVLISGAGGRYVYGHSILDTLGLGWILPGEAP